MRALVLLFAVGCGAAVPLEDSSADLKAPDATVVLIHGMGGFKKLEGLDYFFGVPELYKSMGAKVFVPGTTALASSAKRALELKQQLDAVDGPLILVGHSQGGLDARYLVSKLGYAQRVRAVVTIATPHHGSPVADVALGLAPGALEDAVNVLIGELGWSLDGAYEVTVANMEGSFNKTVLDAPGVTYWSFAGLAAPFGLGSRNGWLHSAFLPTWTLLEAEHLASDGMVPEPSAHWGTFKGTIPADHMGEVDQPVGYTPGFDANAFYRSLLRSFREQGW